MLCYFLLYSKMNQNESCDPMDCSMPGFPVLHHTPEFAQILFTELVMPSNHLILCRPLLLLPSVFPSIRCSYRECFFLILAHLCKIFIPFPTGLFKSFVPQLLLFGASLLSSCFLSFHWQEFAGSSFVSGVLCIANVSPTSLSLTSEILLSFAKTSNFHVIIDSHYFELYCKISNNHQQSQVNNGKYIDWMGSKVMFLLVQNESL